METTTTGARTTTTEPSPIQVLVFHKTAGFRHESIPAGIDALIDIGESDGFEITATEDGSTFGPELAEMFEVIVFLNTTGDVLDEGQQQAMEEFIADGNGFVGIHSAADTEYDWAWYGELLGTYFDNHPAPQPARVEIVDSGHPVMDGLPSLIERFDEWYNFRTVPGPEVSILAALDESSFDGGTMGDDHPIMWAHEYGGGRSFYTAFGHTIESFGEPQMRSLLVNAIRWAANQSG